MKKLLAGFFLVAMIAAIALSRPALEPLQEGDRDVTTAQYEQWKTELSNWGVGEWTMRSEP